MFVVDMDFPRGKPSIAIGETPSLASHTYFGGSGRNTYGDYGQLFGNNRERFQKLRPRNVMWLQGFIQDFLLGRGKKDHARLLMPTLNKITYTSNAHCD